MCIKIRRFTFFVLSILVVACAVTGCSNEIDPMKKQPAQPKHKQIIAPQVTEKKDIKRTNKTGTPFEKMSASQISQMKRSDCRLREETIPHDYKK